MEYSEYFGFGVMNIPDPKQKQGKGLEKGTGGWKFPASATWPMVLNIKCRRITAALAAIGTASFFVAAGEKRRLRQKRYSG